MHTLDNLEVGLTFWATGEPREVLKAVKKFEVRSGQLGFPGELALSGAAESWSDALAAEDFLVVTAFCSYIGEDYSDIPSVQRTVGLVPLQSRAERLARTKAVSDVAAQLGIESVACHIGFLPEDRDKVHYHEMVEVVRDICGHCDANGQVFALETGQEPAKVLLRLIEDVARPNLQINFDPANMILYGTGEPIDALTVLSKYVISVHCKDGKWPALDNPAALGIEVPLGEGDVGIPEFVAQLKEIGYTGILSIEREEPDPHRRAADIRRAVALLRKLTVRSPETA